ncbi:C-type natriuretic peptide-like [Hemitrygon akajei]|uniref:C-type natriuretic peptide-like n=1 Tax=Hemitrygon akajei TaxID=2704970 RepID=UPI003BF97C8D
MGAYTAYCYGLLLALLVQVYARPSPEQSLQALTRRLEEAEHFLDNEELDNEGVEASPADISFDLQNGAREMERGLDGNTQEFQTRPRGSDNFLLRLLQDITMVPRRARTRSKKGSRRGCFGMKLDRIGSMSRLGC